MRTLTPWFFIVAAATACNASGLDRGSVSVAGLVPSTKASATSAPIAASGTTATVQTRQTAYLAISQEVASRGRFLSLSRTSPAPVAELFSGFAYPVDASDPVTANEALIAVNPAGGLLVSFYTATLVHAGQLSYGANTLEFTISENGDTTATYDVGLTLMDFDISSVALSSFTHAEVSDDGESQGWVSMFAQPSVQEQSPSGASSSLQAGLFNIINP